MTDPEHNQPDAASVSEQYQADLAEKEHDPRTLPIFIRQSRDQGLDVPAADLQPGTGAHLAENQSPQTLAGDPAPDEAWTATLHWPAETNPTELEPSLALLRQPRPNGDTTTDPNRQPRFGTLKDGRSTVAIPTEAGTHLYGAGEHCGHLEHSGRRMVCWNVDIPDHDDRNPALYQSHPWILAVREDGTAAGYLADTTRRVEIDCSSANPDNDGTINFHAEHGPFRLITVESKTPQGVVRALAELTGTTPMPPLWSLGYHQCRWSYHPDDRVREIAAGFRSRNIPCDVIWLDIDYMDEYRIFSFHPEKFPDPAGLNKELHDQGYHTVWMIDPAASAVGDTPEEQDPVYKDMVAKDLAINTPDGKPYIGRVWPDKAAWPDFTNPATRAWWADLFPDFMAHGIDGVWNDMNEPANFAETHYTLPDDTLHKGGPLEPSSAATEESTHLPPANHTHYHNAYGLLMTRSTREGILKSNPDKRPFVLTRANFIGGQRYAATWTGDNQGDWDHLAWSVSTCLNLSLSGQPFCGPDIGGFDEAGDPDPERFARWMGLGCLLPFARAHAAAHNKNKEPWSMGKACEDTCRRAIETRMRLLPYLYTLFRDAHLTGSPVIRPIFFTEPDNPDLRTEDRAFLLGNDLLVIPNVEAGHTQAGYPRALPLGDWEPFNPLQGDRDPDLPQLRLRSGAILPMGPIMQHTGQRPTDPLTLVVHTDNTGHAAGLLYEDAGDGFAYETGDFRLTRFTATRAADGKVEIEETHIAGDRPRTNRDIITRVI